MTPKELRQLIKQKHGLLMRETFSRPGYNRSEHMPDDMKDRFIEYLAEKSERDDLEKRAMSLVLEDLAKEISELKGNMQEMLSEQADIKIQLTEEQKARKASDRENAKLKEQLKFANKNRFGSKKQSVGKKQSKDDDDMDIPTREEEKERFDGTDDTLSMKSVSTAEDTPQEALAPKERDLSNRPEEYQRMSVKRAPVKHPSDLSKVPGRIIDRKMVKTFHLDLCLIEEQFEMVQYVENGKKPKWGYFPQQGHPQVVTKFDGTKATPEFLQAIAYEVYVKNVTFGLLHRWLTDMGMTISENTLRNWLNKGKKYLDQLVWVLKQVALEKDSIINCDETWCKVRKYDRYKKCYMWVLVNKAEQIVIFFYEDGSSGRDVLTNFLGDAELKSLMSDGYNAYVFIGDELKSAKYKDTDHQICMAHVRDKFARASLEGCDRNAAVFVENIDKLYEFERGYETFTYIKDGNYPIDNNLAERSVRPFTTKRKNSLHFGSDAGAEMAAAYYSVISTVKLQSKSVWEYLGKFFTGIFNGCRDFFESDTTEYWPASVAITGLYPKNLTIQ